jgi:hypothetical protein
MRLDLNEIKARVQAAWDLVDGLKLEAPFSVEAFKAVLASTLPECAGSPSAPTGQSQPKAARAQQAAESVSALRKKPQKSKGASVPESTLSLEVADLRKLGEFWGRLGAQSQGTEQIAFLLANFARLHTELKFITASDIAHLHRQPISLRMKVPPVNDPADWARALSWLTAPSRGKQWLQKRGEGYAVSNSGLLRWHELEEEATHRKTGDKVKG